MTDDEFHNYLKDNANKLYAKVPDDYMIIARNGIYVNFSKYPPTDTTS